MTFAREPFHAVAGSIFSTVANPASPVNPFGATARQLRDEVIDQTTDLIVRLIGLANLPVLRGSRRRVLALVRSVSERSHSPA